MHMYNCKKVVRLITPHFTPFYRRRSRKYSDRVFWGYENFLDHALFRFGRRPFSLGSVLPRVVTALFIRDRGTIFKVERGAKIGRRVKLGSEVFCPEKYLSHSYFKSKKMRCYRSFPCNKLTKECSHCLGYLSSPSSWGIAKHTKLNLFAFGNV